MASHLTPHLNKVATLTNNIPSLLFCPWRLVPLTLIHWRNVCVSGFYWSKLCFVPETRDIILCFYRKYGLVTTTTATLLLPQLQCARIEEEIHKWNVNRFSGTLWVCSITNCFLRFSIRQLTLTNCIFISKRGNGCNRSKDSRFNSQLLQNYPQSNMSEVAMSPLR